MKIKQHETTLTLKERVNLGLARNWTAAILILAVVVAVMVAILIFDTLQENRRADSTMLAEDIQETFVEWLREAPESRNDEELNALISTALADYPGHFAAQRALFTKGLMALEQKEWTAAADDFRELANRRGESYLAPVSLFNAGSALEQAGDVDGAEEAWTTLVENYAEVAPDAPEALFNLGRLAEAAGDVDTALERYGEIASRFPESRWTNLSKSRILVIDGRS